MKALTSEDINFKLYKKETIKSQMFELKEEILEEVLDLMEYKINASFKEGRRSNDWFEPDEGDEILLELIGKINIEKLNKRIGTLKEYDVELIEMELWENEEVRGVIKEMMDEEKLENMPEIQWVKKTIKAQKENILIEAKAEFI